MYVEKNEFLGLKMSYYGGEHFDDNGITDWVQYEALCPGDYNWDMLISEGLELIIVDSLD